MPEEIENGQEDVVVEETQEQPQSEETAEVMSTPETPTEEPVEGELDPSVKERTKEQFEKLKAEKEELKHQLDARKDLPSVLDFLGTPTAPVPQETKQQYMQPVQLQPVYNQQVPQEVKPAPTLVDDQGYVNAEFLNKELEEARKSRKQAEEANERARKAEERISRFEINSETKALYQSYPELDPKSESFNQEAYELVRNDLTSQMVTSGTRDAMASASKLSKYFRTQPNEVKAQKVLEQRNQVAVSGTTPRQSTGESFESLKARSLHDDNAMAERLRRLES